MIDFITYNGPCGSIYEQPPMPAREGMPQQDACLTSWLLLAPPAHPLWPHYVLFCAHLRDIEGQITPPQLRFPNASHEIDLLALNPDMGPWTQETFLQKMTDPTRTKGVFLTPLNASVQIADATDSQAIELTRAFARALVDGFVPIEPDDWRNGRQRWEDAAVQTLEHIKFGGHST
jgi:hypothetical protein